jgi:hypothetical protein
VSTILGDPASTSALGGALRRQALRLVATDERLGETTRRMVRQGGTDPTLRERELVLQVAEQLDRIGGLLQALATDVVEDAAKVRQLVAEAARSDLVVDGHHVVEAPGPSRADPASRLAARDHLQQLLNRVTAQDARTRARLLRELEGSSAALARTSERARLGHD